MSRLIQLLFAFALAGIASIAIAQHYYQPDQPGHGLTVQAVGSGYAAQWYAHDGDGQRWFASDVCDYGDSCPVFVTDGNGFPAVGAEIVEAGYIVLDRIEQGVLLTYDLEIEGVDCSQVLPAPLPPQCVNPDGSRNWDYKETFSASGAIELDVLIE